MMKHLLMSVICLALLATPAMTAEKKAAVKTQKERISYMLGADMGKRMKAELTRMSIDVDSEVMAKGIKDAMGDGKLLLTDAELQEVRTALQNEIMAKSTELTKVLGEKNKREGGAFLAENRKQDGIKTTASGLQYKVSKEGSGKTPAATDTVTVNYRGTLIDGTEFDSSIKRNAPATFALNQVIKGWTEGIQLMKEGGKTTFFIPSELAYGEQGTPGGPIGPNAVLIFEVELLSVSGKAQAAGQPEKGITGK